MAGAQPCALPCPGAERSPSSATLTSMAADRLHHATAPHHLHPPTGSRRPRAGLVSWRRGGPLPPGLPHGARLGKQGPSPARLSLSAAPAVADDGAAAVGAEAVDINELHARPALAAARLHLWWGRMAVRPRRGRALRRDGDSGGRHPGRRTAGCTAPAAPSSGRAWRGGTCRAPLLPSPV